MPSFVNIANETHGGDDVVLYANGPMAELFGGQIDNNFLAYGMAAALCVGPAKEICGGAEKNDVDRIFFLSFLWILLFVFLLIFLYSFCNYWELFQV